MFAFYILSLDFTLFNCYLILMIGNVYNKN